MHKVTLTKFGANQTVMKCDLCEFKTNELYEAWFAVKCPFTGQTMINQLHRVCRYCAKYSKAYEAHGEEVFEMSKQNEWFYQI
jgi:hypothetical protein